MTLSDVLSFVLSIAPPLLVVGAIIWSLLASPFAWWASKFLSKGFFSRIGCAVVLWMIIILLRLKVSFSLLFKGVLFLKQLHAWRMFVRLTKCFVQCKSETLCMAVIALILSHDPKQDAQEENDIDVESVVKNDELLHGISYSGGKLITLIFCLTRGDQEFLDALLTLIKRRDGDNLTDVIFNLIADGLRKYNVVKVQQNFCKATKEITEMVMKFACKIHDEELAERLVLLRHQIAVLEDSRVQFVGEKGIEAIVNELVIRVNSVCSRLYVACRMKVEEKNIIVLKKPDSAGTEKLNGKAPDAVSESNYKEIENAGTNG